MAIKVGINGYGRIGRNVLRALYERSARAKCRSWRSTTWATRTPTRTYAYDTAHGKFPAR